MQKYDRQLDYYWISILYRIGNTTLSQRFACDKHATNQSTCMMYHTHCTLLPDRYLIIYPYNISKQPTTACKSYS